jgi:hypothetical protein
LDYDYSQERPVSGTMSNLNYLGVGLVGLGAILMLSMLRAASLRWALLRHPVHVQGKVVSIRCVTSSSDDRPGQGKFYPTVRYQSAEGQTMERELPATGNPDKWRVGQKVRLIHQRGNASNVVNEELRWADLVAAAIGSLIVIGIGVVLWFFVQSTPATQ